MDKTPPVASLAPLAFSLSVRSEGVPRALFNNAINSSHTTTYPALIAVGAAAVSAGVLAEYVLPGWLSLLLVGWPGFLCFKYAKRLFEGDFIDGRIRANREVVRSVVDTQDAGLFAGIAAAIVTSQYGNQAWVARANALRESPSSDPYLYLATVFTFAPGSWRLCTRYVYDHLLAGAVPAHA